METAVVEAKTRGAKANVSPRVPDELGLRDEARKYYGEMQTSWFNFAKSLCKIRDTEAFKEYGKKTLKEFCLDEFPSMHFKVILKLMHISESWGKEIESKIEVNPAYRLPAYESCYSMVTAEKNLPKPEAAKLKGEVLSGEMSYHKLRDKLKEIISGREKKIRFRSEAEVEAELVDVIKTDDLDAETAELEKEIGIGPGPQQFKAKVAQIRTRIEFLDDQIPSLWNELEANSDLLTEDVVDVARALEDLTPKINDFLIKLETL